MLKIVYHQIGHFEFVLDLVGRGGGGVDHQGVRRRQLAKRSCSILMHFLRESLRLRMDFLEIYCVVLDFVFFIFGHGRLVVDDGLVVVVVVRVVLLELKTTADNRLLDGVRRHLVIPVVLSRGRLGVILSVFVFRGPAVWLAQFLAQL